MEAVPASPQTEYRCRINRQSASRSRSVGSVRDAKLDGQGSQTPGTDMMMISPHPTTTQLVAEAARKERLAALAASHRHPGLLALGWLYVVRFVAKAGLLGGRIFARNRQRTCSHPTTSRTATRGTVVPRSSAHRQRVWWHAIPEFRRYRPAVNKTTAAVTEDSRALGIMKSDR
jgi:hypothetical protein